MQLLHKTVRTYLIYSISLILLSIPLLYLILNHIITNETKEILELPLQPEMGAKDFVERLKHSISSEQVLIRTILLSQFSVVIGLFIGIYLINKNLSAKIWKPFYHTLEQLKKYELNEGAVLELPVTNISEFDLLNRTILHLTSKNHKVFMMQKEFTDNAAHEMQTPVAIMQGKLELLVQDENLNVEQAEIIESMLAINNRLFHLNHSLLLLARIENEQYIETEIIHLSMLISTMIDQFTDKFKNRNISMVKEVRNPAYIRTNKMLIEILLSNLLSNAIKHNVENGSIHIAINGTEVAITNTGEPFAMDTDKIFERFNKNPANQDSIGLGLSIVRKICENCRYRLTYEYLPATAEHLFKISFA